MVNVYRTKLDIKSVRPDFKPTFVQYDHARLEIKLTDGGQPYNLSNATRVEFTHVLGDNTVIIQPGELIRSSEGYVVAYNYQGSEMDFRGTIKTSFAVFSADGKKVSSPIFDVIVTKDLREGLFEPAEPNFGLLQTLIADVETVKKLGGVKGDKGDTGAPGYTPVKGIDYFDGVNGRDGEKGDPFTYSDFTQSQLDALRGPKGDTGSNGVNGTNGIDGKSAYQVAVSNGYIGTETQWIASLKGTKGDKGETGLGFEKINSFVYDMPIITNSARRLVNGVTNVTVVDDNTVRYTTNSTYGHVGFSIPNIHSNKYLMVVKVRNMGTTNVQNVALSMGYSNTNNGNVGQNGQNKLSIGTILPGASYETVLQFDVNNPTMTTDDAFSFALLGLFTNTNGAQIELTQKVYDVTNLTPGEISQINWKNIKSDTVMKVSYSEISGESLSLAYKGSKWQNKTWITIGDSITSPGTYQTLVKNALGFGTILNKGVAGQSMSTMLDNVTSAEIQSADLITIYGALNHMFPNAPAIGNLTDAPVKTGGSFIAHLKFLIEAIFTIKSTARVVVIGTHNAADEYRPDIYQPITDGKNIGDYVLAMGEVARYYGCPFIDMYGKCGFNAFNLMTYTSDGAHPNALGFQRIAEVITGELQKIEPI